VLVAVEQWDAGVRAACAREGGGVRVVLDPHGETARRYNALWRPRAYALDERGRLTYIQSERTLDLEAPREVRALWERGS
jgi:hypothetical protein